MTLKQLKAEILETYDKLPPVADVDIRDGEWLVSQRDARHLLSAAIDRVAKESSDAVIVEEAKLPKAPCLNAENHMFGSCFQCERIHGSNAARTASLSKQKEYLG